MGKILVVSMIVILSTALFIEGDRINTLKKLKEELLKKIHLN
jgi:hypothetical protein